MKVWVAPSAVLISRPAAPAGLQPPPHQLPGRIHPITQPARPPSQVWPQGAPLSARNRALFPCLARGFNGCSFGQRARTEQGGEFPRAAKVSRELLQLPVAPR